MSEYIDLPEDWIQTYFKDQDKETERDLKSAIINDTKDTGPIIAQLELWDSKSTIIDRLNEIDSIMEVFNTDDWFLTSPSISEGKNYIYTKKMELKKLLESSIKVKFDGDIGTTDRLWLRKEILHELNNN